MSTDVLGALSTRLRADVGVRSAVGLASDGDAKVYVGKAPQAVAIPYVVLRRIAEPPHHHAQGWAEIGSPTVQAHVVASSSVAVQTIIDALLVVLDGVRGQFGSVRIRGAFVVGRYDDVVQTDDASDELPHETVLDLEVWHERVP